MGLPAARWPRLRDASYENPAHKARYPMESVRRVLSRVLEARHFGEDCEGLEYGVIIKMYITDKEIEEVRAWLTGPNTDETHEPILDDGASGGPTTASST